MAGRVIVKGSFTNVSASARFTSALTASIASSPIADTKGRYYAVADGEILSQPVQGTFDAATKTWTVAVVPVAGVIYRISAPGFMPDCFVDSTAYLPMPANADVEVDADTLIGPPGGETLVEYVILTTVIASIDSRIASGVEDYLIAHPPESAATIVAESYRMSWREGVVSDGTTNDLTALSSLMTEVSNAGGGTILMRGVTVLGAALAVPANVELRGLPGAVLKKTGSHSYAVTLAAGATIRDVTVDTNGSVTSGGVNVLGSGARIIGGAITGTMPGAAFAVKVADATTDVTISGVTFTTVGGVRLGASTRTRIERCDFSNYDRAVFAVSTASAGTTGLTVEDCYFHDHDPNATDRQPLSLQTGGGWHRDVRILRNRLYGNGQPHHRTAAGVIMAQLTGTADMISLHGCSGFQVLGNWVQDGGEVGITIAKGSRRGTIDDNQMIGNNTVGIAAGASASSTCEDITIGPGNRYINNGADREVYLADNTTPTHRKGVQGGIWTSDSARVTIAPGQHFLDDQNTPTQLHAVYAARTTGLTVGEQHLGGGTTALWSTDSLTNSTCSGPLTRKWLTSAVTLASGTAGPFSPGFQIPVEVGGRYEFDAMLDVNATSSGDYTLALSLPASSTATWVANAPGGSGTSPNSPIARSTLNAASSQNVAGTGAGTAALPLGQFTAGATGTFDFTIGRQTPEASDIVVGAGSWVRVRRVA